MKAIINYRYRRMAHSGGEKCRLPLLVLTSDNTKDKFLVDFKVVSQQDSLSFSDEGIYSSLWVELPANTIFVVSDEGDYARISKVSNKLSEINWNEHEVYIQRSHIEELPKRYDVQPSVEGVGYQILRYNFSYNYYVPMQKLPVFDNEADAWEYIKCRLEDWSLE